MKLRLWQAIQRLDSNSQTYADRMMIVAFLDKLVHHATEACENPCGCGSGKWPCHVDGDKAIEIALMLVRPR